ncbi:hypothetical protein FKP32DRAFT_604487 [Trametes sanguinea]|nr:hypothetical protein FKP32DRAFT_604487 [Trametes sanguinea]
MPAKGKHADHLRPASETPVAEHRLRRDAALCSRPYTQRAAFGLQKFGPCSNKVPLPPDRALSESNASGRVAIRCRGQLEDMLDCISHSRSHVRSPARSVSPSSSDSGVDKAAQNTSRRAKCSVWGRSLATAPWRAAATREPAKTAVHHQDTHRAAFYRPERERWQEWSRIRVG